MSGLPEPESMSWLELDTYSEIIQQAATELRQAHPVAARYLDYRAQRYRYHRNGQQEAAR